MSVPIWLEVCVLDLSIPIYPEDDTYMENAEDLQHYLLEDVGIIWRGTSSHPLPTKWEFGQVRTLSQHVVGYM